MRLLLILAILSFQIQLLSQNSISGTVENNSGQRLVGASIFLLDTNFAAATDDNGRFVIEDIPAGTYVMKCTYVGFSDLEQSIQLDSSLRLELVLDGTIYDLDRIVITANQLEDEDPFTYQNLSKENIERRNGSQDLPYLLEHTPSMVVTSDAGTGIGYTGLRVRGSDPTRINVTINGIPLNDSESHGVFWVNMPDFSNSVESIQIQRGVGPSTNGSGAFGASLNLNTNELYSNGFININSGYGSFNTRKVAVSMNTGLINNQYQIEGRYSYIASDGYVDRASANLSSWYFSAAKVDENSSLRLNLFSGKETTYQSWWGTPEAIIDEDEEALRAHYNRNVGSIYNTVEDSLNLFNSGRTYNYYTYENQVDDYRQTHVQLFYAKDFQNGLTLNATGHYTKGKGYFEEFRHQEDLQIYLLTDTFRLSDLVRRRWLDNDFYGAIINARYTLNENSLVTVGASANRYVGDHFGNVIAAEQGVNFNPFDRYYENTGKKLDINSYAKFDIALSDRLNVFADVQYRMIDYSAAGLDNGSIPIAIDTSYKFFNPKAGISYNLTAERNIYLSYARAQREPVRNDFIDAIGTAVPEPEKLDNIELGFRSNGAKSSYGINLYYMSYKDQLVVTGALNDVGGAIRQNVSDSYRMGIELQMGRQLNDALKWDVNLSYSQNKIDAFQEIIADYDNGGLIINDFENTDIAFSPNIVAGSVLEYAPNSFLKLYWQSKFVGRQYLDNTSNINRSIDPYWVNDIIVKYTLPTDYFEMFELKLMVNNLLNASYVSNGYSYSYSFGELVTENFYYPQAGIHFNLGLNVTF
ncbi:MAG: TonB-dependent receptor [Saprospiraceae bacterium]|nr:TonB-dependent receptor [Saprospiraceae bacterium]